MHKYWEEHWKNTKKADDQIQCFDKARYQLHIAGFDTTGNPYDETSYFQLFVETDNGDGGRVDVSDIPRTSEAILYLKDKLTHGIPVMVGIRMSGFDRRPNPDGTTNHFVVIVGMGRDEDATSLEPKYFFRYFDYLIPETMEFYVFNFPTLMLASSSGRRRVAQVRKTVRE
jgi:hypothetical protein